MSKPYGMTADLRIIRPVLSGYCYACKTQGDTPHDPDGPFCREVQWTKTQIEWPVK